VQPATSPNDQRLLVLAPTGRDAELICTVLADAGVDCVSCADMRELCRALPDGAGALAIAEEALAEGAWRDLAGMLAQEPPWSEPPLLLLSERGADSPTLLQAMASLGNVTVLERPMRVPALVSAAYSALRSRARQYQIRSYLEERERYTRALTHADKRKDEFLATLAHELRNPLAPMRTALEIMRIAPGDESARGHAQAVLERQTLQMARLIDDLLDVSRISHGKLELRREEVDLNAVIQGALEVTRPLIDAEQHELRVDLPEEPVFLDADPTRLTQVFCNLLNNAAKYTDRGGAIELTARVEGDQVCIRVRDNGIGIAAENLDRIFDMFTQVGRSLEQSRGGLGVGLALTQWLVHLHGGSIEAKSAGLGRGTEVLVRLPVISPSHSYAVGADSPEHSAPAAGRRILIADDNRDFADSLGALLQVAGHCVRTVYDGEQAVRTACEWLPEVALLDIGLPHVNGYEVAERIAGALANDRPLLVAITGWGQIEDRRRAREAGFVHHFVKPVDPRSLLSLLAIPLRPAEDAVANAGDLPVSTGSG
jgi:signal transduction histidine kinase/ActR/RegA family two-component response regulator